VGDIVKLFGKAKAGQASRLPSELQADSSRFKVIIDNLEDGVVLLDDQGVIQMINPGAAAICGWSVDESAGLSIQAVIKLVDDKGGAYATNPFQQVFTEGQTLHLKDAFLLNRDKKQLPLSLTVLPLAGADKQVTAAVAVLRDVSRERVEEQQRADFISTASHEMRTPVAAIEGYLALTLNEKVATVDNRARDYLEKARSSAQHLGTLFQDLLTSAKAEDGRLTSHPSVIEVGEFLEQLVSDLQLIAEKKGLFMEFVNGAGGVINATHTEGGERTLRPLFYAYADQDRLREVITNLFDNAVKYTEEGKISIGLTGNDQVVQCYVRDTGPGIPADDVPHLFQKFYRVDNSATRTIGGTGLGLFICRKIIELYNGRIWVESELGKGSTFYINLPRLTTERARQLQAQPANLAVKPSTPTATT
jgi:PAS domain S-box-containing protein